MEIVGGFMVMMSIIGFFLAVVWLVMPFVVLTIKGKIDRVLDQLTGIEQRLGAIEARLALLEREKGTTAACIPGAGDAPDPPGPLPLV